MRNEIAELRLPVSAIKKLGARRISAPEVRQLADNRHVVAHNPHQPRHARWPRRLLIGSTNGGRCLTLVIESTVDPTTWVVITGCPQAQASVG